MYLNFPSGHSLGIDLGFDKFVATSDGVEYNRPKFLKTLQHSATQVEITATQVKKQKERVK